MDATSLSLGQAQAASSPTRVADAPVRPVAEPRVSDLEPDEQRQRFRNDIVQQTARDDEARFSAEGRERADAEARARDDAQEKAVAAEQRAAVEERALEDRQADEGVREEADEDERRAVSRDEEALDPSELARLRDLQSRDREVRQHEQAHKAVGGSQAGGVRYQYEEGPDQRRYAVSGEVPISFERDGDPREVISEAERARRAALAPAEPSAQDRRIAAEAAAAVARAQMQMLDLRMQQRQADTEAAIAQAVGPDGNGQSPLIDLFA